LEDIKQFEKLICVFEEEAGKTVQIGEQVINLRASAALKLLMGRNNSKPA
jgi:hypothetical protein